MFKDVYVHHAHRMLRIALAKHIAVQHLKMHPSLPDFANKTSTKPKHHHTTSRHHRITKCLNLPLNQVTWVTAPILARPNYEMDCFLACTPHLRTERTSSLQRIAQLSIIAWVVQFSMITWFGSVLARYQQPQSHSPNISATNWHSKQVTRGIGDVNNPFLLQLENGNLLCAFRNHTTNAVGNQMYFRITICASEDGGRCWKYLSTAEEVPSVPSNIFRLMLTAGAELKPSAGPLGTFPPPRQGRRSPTLLQPRKQSPRSRFDPVLGRSQGDLGTWDSGERWNDRGCGGITSVGSCV
jgi:hypothetical protein